MAQFDRGEGVWPSSPRMADSGGNGGIWRGPEPLGHRQWIGCVKGGGEEGAVHGRG
jgi:hypothetical protein